MDYIYPIDGKTLLDPNDYLSSDYDFADAVAFVAIKNGEHQSKGFLAIDPTLTAANFNSGEHVARIHDVILDLFPEKRVGFQSDRAQSSATMH